MCQKKWWKSKFQIPDILIFPPRISNLNFLNSLLWIKDFRDVSLDVCILVLSFKKVARYRTNTFVMIFSFIFYFLSRKTVMKIKSFYFISSFTLGPSLYRRQVNIFQVMTGCLAHFPGKRCLLISERRIKDHEFVLQQIKKFFIFSSQNNGRENIYFLFSLTKNGVKISVFLFSLPKNRRENKVFILSFTVGPS